ncbi:MAG TPA: hypothetical protein PJ989_08895 [Oligoflexia bacterium]|nr:hypothetical protein [Oligoflexia bacterium]
MRGVPTFVESSFSFLLLRSRDSLQSLFLNPACGLFSDTGVLYRGLRAETLSLLNRGVFGFVGIVESTEMTRLTSQQIYRGFLGPDTLDARASGYFLQSHLSVESLSEMTSRIVVTLYDLSLLSRSIFRAIRGVSGPVRKDLWRDYSVVDRVFRDILRSELLLYAPNSRTGRKLPEEMLRPLAEVILSERKALPDFMGKTQAEMRARDALVLLKGSPLLTVFGRVRNSQYLVTEDVMNILDSKHAKHRRGLVADLLSHLNLLSQEELKLRFLMSDREGDFTALRLASDALSVHTHLVVRALGALT